jgi:hypothetical protein
LSLKDCVNSLSFFAARGTVQEGTAAGLHIVGQGPIRAFVPIRLGMVASLEIESPRGS